MKWMSAMQFQKQGQSLTPAVQVCIHATFLHSSMLEYSQCCNNNFTQHIQLDAANHHKSCLNAER